MQCLCVWLSMFVMLFSHLLNMVDLPPTTTLVSNSQFRLWASWWKTYNMRIMENNEMKIPINDNLKRSTVCHEFDDRSENASNMNMKLKGCNYRNSEWIARQESHHRCAYFSHWPHHEMMDKINDQKRETQRRIIQRDTKDSTYTLR
jgi:hypothetical protein